VSQVQSVMQAALVTSLVLTLATSGPGLAVHSVSSGCLQCGSPCLAAVEGGLQGCLTTGLAAAGAAAGLDVVSPAAAVAGGELVRCLRGLVDTLSACSSCAESLVCCVTDSCSLCECNCHNLLRFSAPLSSLTRQQQPWLFAPSCHFAYIGTPACQDCDGKRVYQSVDCANSVYLHYHDYILDGRWVLTADVDSDDTAAVVRNKGDGLDDEECPELEGRGWELRTRTSPAAGWALDPQLSLQQFVPGNRTIQL